MSDEQKIYAPASAKMVTFERTGNSILKLSFKADAFIAFINQRKNAKGYVNLGISKRKEVGKYGETHTVWLDTWEPKNLQSGDGTSPPVAAGKPDTKPAAPNPVDDDPVPF